MFQENLLIVQIVLLVTIPFLGIYAIYRYVRKRLAVKNPKHILLSTVTPAELFLAYVNVVFLSIGFFLWHSPPKSGLFSILGSWYGLLGYIVLVPICIYFLAHVFSQITGYQIFRKGGQIDT